MLKLLREDSKGGESEVEYFLVNSFSERGREWD